MSEVSECRGTTLMYVIRRMLYFYGLEQLADEKMLVGKDSNGNEVRVMIW